MEAEMVEEDIVRSMSDLRKRVSFGELIRTSASFHEKTKSEINEEQDLKWEALWRLPTYDRMRKGILKQVLDNGKVNYEEVDITKLGVEEKKHLLESIIKTAEEDNENFLHKMRDRIDRVGIEIPKIEVRFENLSVEGDAYDGTRALPTLVNATLNVIEGLLGYIKILAFKKRVAKILKDVSGIIKPSRMTLLLGPPSSGKTTLLQALAGKLDKDLRVSGRVTYNGHELSEFVPQRTCAYISQHDLHHGETTVRETLDFSGRCLGVGTRYDMLTELSRREKAAGIKPDPEIDAFMKVTSMEGQETSLVTDYILKILGLETCADILVGDEMRRGISGGQKKRLTTGEMLVGPAKALFMDGISTGLDSSTTFQIVRFMRQMVHITDVTMIISLLQPAPETYNLFDDIILLSEGEIVYQGPRESVLDFFQNVGFKCPERKGIADFLQEVTSRKDQEQYWFRRDIPYEYVSVPDFVIHFNNYSIGRELHEEIKTPFDSSKAHHAALVKEKFGISKWELFKACFSREWLFMKRSYFVYIFKTFQITIMSLITMTVFFRTRMEHGKLEDGGKYYGALFFSLINVMFNGAAELAMTVNRLPVFFKQRDFLFYPAWAFALPIWVLRVPLSIVESVLWIILTYYTIGFAPAPSRFFRQLLAFFCVNQMALSLFRFIAAIGRTRVVANTFASITILVIFVLSGFTVSRDDIDPWMIWCYYASPMMYGMTAISINEFLDKRWSTPNIDPRIDEPTVGKAFLKARGIFTEDYWYWISIGALVGFSLLFNVCFILALTYLDPFRSSKSIIVEQEDNRESTTKSSSVEKTTGEMTESSASNVESFEGVDMEVRNNTNSSIPKAAKNVKFKKGMVLPFQPLSLVFENVNYYINMPNEMKTRGIEENRLQLLRDISGAFRPGILTALVGVSGAGKTTLMDVLSGRKTSGYIEGSISISGYPKNQATFARISGYCEQNDIHSPNITVYESLLFSAWLRLSKEVDIETRKMFIEEVIELVELHQVRNFLVGLPGIDGLSTEQRKRLTIAVELVANPSIIFMDEPTTGLDARAAAVVMRTVRNTVDTGRTVVCTIHQPSIDIFENFDELLLMKTGGQVIYGGPLGRNSEKLIEYFEAITGIPKIEDGYNPATWMLEISSPVVESQLDIDFAELYNKSSLYQRNQELIKELSIPAPGTKDLYYPSKYSQSFVTQCSACFWKQYRSYWRNPQYNAIRFFITIVIGLMFGLIYWKKGEKMQREQDLLNLVGAMYSSVIFLGASNTSSVQPIVAIERTVLYRERAAGMYSELTYAIGQVAIEVIYVAIQSLIYSNILYWMLGFPPQVENFFWFYFLIFMSFLYFTLYGLMTVALTPNHQIAAIVMSFFISFWNLFSGFLIPRTQIPIWWRWYYWASPVAWTIYGLVTSQVGDKNSPIEVPGYRLMTVKDYLERRLGFEHDFLGYVALAHIAFCLLFLFVFAYGIKFLNFQKR
ncbi:putative monosaccharide-transporting ATPase [Medicago truncatula]|uniref:Putative monosaccharide-transporting ATPase n=1 Tax=Medicago truncatula TaxID=3880 RepID=A0A396JW50_MEDTR|nr:pleiotropic drug resistance protein 2 [Medicago truncatula]RHN78937.1 putative monosaccharide-transporting ATPase [Medicago truncatula]